MPESWASSEHARRSMVGNRSRDTKPELAVRRLVHAKGMRYLVSARPVAGLRRTADLVFRRPRVAVFVDGCYWHGCPAHFRQPTANADYWRAKVARNAQRDLETDAALRDAGWVPLRFWSHEDPAEVVRRIESVVRSRSG